MSATINQNKLMFTIFGHGHDYTLNNSGNGGEGKKIFSHPFVPLGSTIYAGQFYFEAPVYDEGDLSADPVMTDVVRFDNDHCTFSPALGSTFSSEGTITVSVHYYREYEGEEETIVVERNFSQDITVVDHGNVDSEFWCTTTYSDGYVFITNHLYYVHDDPQHIPEDEYEFEQYAICDLEHTSVENGKLSSLPFRLISVDCIEGSIGDIVDISELAYADVSTVQSFTTTFCYCQVSDFSALAEWDVSNVTSIYRMFDNCSNLSDISFMANWNFENNVSFDDPFYMCSAITSLDGLEDFDTSHVVNFKGMFNGCTGLSDVSAVENWDVSNCTRMSSMFYDTDISDLTPFADWDVSNVTNMGGMFGNNKNLETLHGLEDWDVSNVTDMSSMFRNYDSVLNYEGWGKLRDISAIEHWDVSSVTNMGAMFRGSKWLSDLTPISDWDVSSVTNMAEMFCGGSALLGVSALNDWDFSSVTSMSKMFHSFSDFYHINYPPVVDDMIYLAIFGEPKIYLDYNRSLVEGVPDLYATKYDRSASSASSWNVSGSGRNAFDSNWLNIPSWN